MNSYIINLETLLIIPYGRGKSKILENDRTFVVNETTSNILKNSCLFFGCSVEGRREAVKQILDIDMKVPIILENKKNIIFFPISDCVKKSSTWISYQNLLKYSKFNEFSTMVYFKNNKNIRIDVKYNLIDNQVIRCIKLENLINKRNNFLKLDTNFDDYKNAI